MSKDTRQMQDRSGTLLSSKHREVFLMTIQIGKEYDAGLVVLSRRAEQLAGQCNGRIEDFAKCFDTGGAILIR